MPEDVSYFYTLLALAGIWALVVVSPGPCFVATVQRTVAGSRREGFFVALGVATGTIIWCSASLLGLEILFTKFNWLYHSIRILGILYLLYLGIKTIVGAHQPLPIIEKSSAETVRLSAAWKQGLLSDLSNPKAAIFFTSLFVALLPAQAPWWLLVSAVSIIVLIEFAWYCLVSYFMSLTQVTQIYTRIKKWIDYLTGGALVLLAGRLA